jgi:hypothetical protein
MASYIVADCVRHHPSQILGKKYQKTSIMSLRTLRRETVNEY